MFVPCAKVATTAVQVCRYEFLLESKEVKTSSQLAASFQRLVAHGLRQGVQKNMHCSAGAGVTQYIFCQQPSGCQEDYQDDFSKKLLSRNLTCATSSQTAGLPGREGILFAEFSNPNRIPTKEQQQARSNILLDLAHARPAALRKFCWYRVLAMHVLSSVAHVHAVMCKTPGCIQGAHPGPKVEGAGMHACTLQHMRTAFMARN